MKRIIMISDIHGCVNELNGLLAKVDYKSETDQLILLGEAVIRCDTCG